MTVANPDVPGTTPTEIPTEGAVGAQPSVGTPRTIVDPVEPPAVPQDWPDDWRNRMAGDPSEYESEDDYSKELKRLEERFKSPRDIFKSYREMEKFAKSRKADVPRPGPNASAEEVEKYRMEKGIPSSAKDYKLEFEDGFTIGEDYREAVEDILEFAHENHFDNETAKTVVRRWIDVESDKIEAMAQADEEQRVSTLNALRQEWGAEFQGNINAVSSVFQNAPKELMARLLTAKDPDTGLSIGNDPDTVRWLVDLGKAINPTATLIPQGANDAASINDEINKIESMMWSQDPAERKRYRSDDALQARYRDLLMAKQRMQG